MNREERAHPATSFPKSRSTYVLTPLLFYFDFLHSFN